MNMAKHRSGVMIRNLMRKKQGYELFVALEKKLDLNRMRFNCKKLDSEGINALADAYEKAGNIPKARLFKEFGEYLSIAVEMGVKRPDRGLDCDMFCEFLESYIIANDAEKIEMLQSIYRDGGCFKEAIDEYYKKVAADDETPLLDYLYERAIITKDPDLLKTAYQLYKEASEYDGWDKNMKLLLLGAVIAEVGEE